MKAGQCKSEGAFLSQSPKDDDESRPATNHPDEGPIEAAVDDAIDVADHGRVTLKGLLEAWGDRSYGPLFIIIGLFTATPLSAIPPTAAVTGVVIALLAVQMLFGKHHPWLPRAVRERSISVKKLRAARQRFAPMLAFLDRFIKERMNFATGPMMRRIAAAIVLVLSLLFVPFELVPFFGVFPASAVVLFGVAITARDGLAMLVGLAGFIGVLAVGVALIF